MERPEAQDEKASHAIVSRSRSAPRASHRVEIAVNPLSQDLPERGIEIRRIQAAAEHVVLHEPVPNSRAVELVILRARSHILRENQVVDLETEAADSATSIAGCSAGALRGFCARTAGRGGWWRSVAGAVASFRRAPDGG